jgi:hypothetical protein
MVGFDPPWFWNCGYDHYNFDCKPSRFSGDFPDFVSLPKLRLQAMIANVAKEDVAVATGITYLFRTTGQVLGVSLSGALLQAILTKQLRKRITGPEAFEV